MRRESKNVTIDQAIKDAIDRVVERILATIDTQVNRAVNARVATTLKQSARGVRAKKAGVAKARPRVEITTWVADRRARRVPNFVIEATGLDTKKRIVAKFGEGVKFDKGKPLPKSHAAGHDAASNDSNGTKAKPPLVRRAAAKKSQASPP